MNINMPILPLQNVSNRAKIGLLIFGSDFQHVTNPVKILLVHYGNLCITVKCPFSHRSHINISATHLFIFSLETSISK